MVWAGAIGLFFNRWGKIRMLLPYQPDYKQDQLKVPGTGVCATGACNGQHSHQVTPLMVIQSSHFFSLINYFTFQLTQLQKWYKNNTRSWLKRITKRIESNIWWCLSNLLLSPIIYWPYLCYDECRCSLSCRVSHSISWVHFRPLPPLSTNSRVCLLEAFRDVYPKAGDMKCIGNDSANDEGKWHTFHLFSLLIVSHLRFSPFFV